MKKTLKIAGLSLGSLFVVVTVVGFLSPRKARAERSVVVNASPEAIYPLIANFKDGWPQWSPFQYPNTKMVYEGPTLGAGAAQRWDGPDSGDGYLKILKGDPARGIEMEMGMMQDSYKAVGSLICEPASQGGTKVTWVDEFDMGSNPYRRFYGLALPLMLEPEFDKGLVKLKSVVEAGAVAATVAP